MKSPRVLGTSWHHPKYPPYPRMKKNKIYIVEDREYRGVALIEYDDAPCERDQGEGWYGTFYNTTVEQLKKWLREETAKIEVWIILKRRTKERAAIMKVVNKLSSRVDMKKGRK